MLLVARVDEQGAALPRARSRTARARSRGSSASAPRPCRRARSRARSGQQQPARTRRAPRHRSGAPPGTRRRRRRPDAPPAARRRSPSVVASTQPRGRALLTRAPRRFRVGGEVGGLEIDEPRSHALRSGPRARCARAASRAPRRATRSAWLTCCSTSSTPTPCSSAACADGVEQPLTMSGASPSESSSASRMLRLAGERPGERQHLLLAAREQPGAAPSSGSSSGKSSSATSTSTAADAEVVGDGEPHEHRPLLGDERQARCAPACTAAPSSACRRA